MSLESIKAALLLSYEQDGGINHLDGANLPSEAAVDALARGFMHLLFPGFFERQAPTRSDVASLVGGQLAEIERSLRAEIAKALAYAGRSDAQSAAGVESLHLLGQLPALRKLIQTDVEAAYTGDPAARSHDEIILAYPCVLVISLQRIAHILYLRGVPLLPRMLTEYAHERTGADIHPGAQIGTHFFVDHCTGVVIGETATIGDHVKLYQGVTLGAKSFALDAQGNPVKGVKRHPDVGDHVTIYAGATILGGDTLVGAHSIIGSNVWLMSSVPTHSLVTYEGANLSVRHRRKHEALEVELPLAGYHYDI
jgi:serine O-acetyltransferase